MIDGNEKGNGWLNLDLQSLHVIERRSKRNTAYTKSNKTFRSPWEP